MRWLEIMQEAKNIATTVTEGDQSKAIARLALLLAESASKMAAGGGASDEVGGWL